MLDVATIRAAFPILETKVDGRPLVYFDNSATSQKPRSVIDAVTRAYLQGNSNIHRGVHRLGAAASSGYENARRTVQRFIGALEEEEVIFTRGATEGINLVAASCAGTFIGRGDEILVTEMEHHSNIVPWQMACARSGAVLRVLPFHDDGTLALDVLEGMIGQRTKMVAVSHVSNVLGTVNPVKEICGICHEHGVPVLVDAAQSIPHMPVDVGEIGCDFLVFSGHKIHAETGIGVLYGRREWLERMPPYQGGGGMVSNVKMEHTTYAPPPLRFEAGTPNYVGAMSLAAAIDYVSSIRMEDIMRHEEELNRHMLQRLGAWDDITLYGRARDRCPIFSFNLQGVHAYDAGQILDRMGIAVRTGTHCAEPVMDHYGITGTVRASLAFYNTVEEIDLFFAALETARDLLR